jgi:hypothetical protein
MIPQPAAPFGHSIVLLHCNTAVSATIRRKMEAVFAGKTLSQNCQAGDISK